MVRFEMFYGMSDNKWRWVDIDSARGRAGYVPRDRDERAAHEGAGQTPAWVGGAMKPVNEEQPVNEDQPVILDMDPGVDDALAIVLAAHSPELRVTGICTVSGNVPVDLGTANSLKILEMMGRTDIAVYAGGERPLRRKPVHALEVHGASGLGEAELPPPRSGPAGPAVPFLVDALTEMAGEIVVIATGPLTNLARAEMLVPGVLGRAKEVVVMGGALREPGNVAPRSEFNFFADPHAARLVVNSGANLTLVPLDATRQVFLSRQEIQQQLTAVPTTYAAFCEAATRTPMAWARQRSDCDGIHLHDPLAVALVIDRELCGVESRRLDVETEGQLTAGMVVVDERHPPPAEPWGTETRCALSADRQRFMQMFMARVLR